MNMHIILLLNKSSQETINDNPNSEELPMFFKPKERKIQAVQTSETNTGFSDSETYGDLYYVNIRKIRSLNKIKLHKSLIR